MSINRTSAHSLHVVEHIMTWVSSLLRKLSRSAGAMTLAHVETSMQARTRLQADLFAIDRSLRIAEPGTERYRQLTAERRRILLTLGAG
jgi:hypothetical protein